MPTEINGEGKLVEMDGKDQLVCITPFESEIIGADKTHIYVKELVIEDEDNAFPCVLKIPRHEYIRIVNIWIDAKADYCERFEHFCGIFGNFRAVEYMQEGEINILLYFDKETDDPVYQDVPLVEVTRFDDQCDMEHG